MLSIILVPSHLEDISISSDKISEIIKRLNSEESPGMDKTNNKWLQALPAECPLSYRPINLLSSLSNILEKIIKEKLSDFIEGNKRNMIQPLVRILKLVTVNFNNGKSTGMVVLDKVYKMIRFQLNLYLSCYRKFSFRAHF